MVSMPKLLHKTINLWILSFILAAFSGIYQRVTGPSYPLHGSVSLGARKISYSLDRSHGGPTNHTVAITTRDTSIHGALDWKRYRSADEWTSLEMHYLDGELIGELPHQPPSGKIQYRVHLHTGEQQADIPSDGTVIMRFRGNIPLAILVLHVASMFIGMLFSTRAGLECFSLSHNYRRFISFSIGFLFVGGAILGPLVQWYAFGAFWTGWPLGTDLTDNKTALALLTWIVAGFALRRSKSPRVWVLTAAITTLAVYLIPHSLLGSELDYSAPGQVGPGTPH